MSSMRGECANCRKPCNNAEYVTDDRRVCCSVKCVTEYYKKRKEREGRDDEQ